MNPPLNTTKEEKKCTCLEDNKLSQVICPLHPPLSHKTWEEELTDLHDFYSKKLLLKYGSAVMLDVNWIKDFIHSLLADTEKNAKEEKTGETRRIWYQKGYDDAEREVLEEMQKKLSFHSYGVVGPKTKAVIIAFKKKFPMKNKKKRNVSDTKE